MEWFEARSRTRATVELRSVKLPATELPEASDFASSTDSPIAGASTRAAPMSGSKSVTLSDALPVRTEPRLRAAVLTGAGCPGRSARPSSAALPTKDDPDLLHVAPLGPQTAIPTQPGRDVEGL
jgi:hypothetical protein